MKNITLFNFVWDAPRVTTEGLTRAYDTGDNIAGVHRNHSPVKVFDLIVAGLRIKSFYRKNCSLLRGNRCPNNDLPMEIGITR